MIEFVEHNWHSLLWPAGAGEPFKDSLAIQHHTEATPGTQPVRR